MNVQYSEYITFIISKFDTYRKGSLGRVLQSINQYLVFQKCLKIKPIKISAKCPNNLDKIVVITFCNIKLVHKGILNLILNLF